MPISRRALLAGAAAPASAQTGRPRNLVFILSDDHRYDALSCMGHPWMETPP